MKNCYHCKNAKMNKYYEHTCKLTDEPVDHNYVCDKYKELKNNK